MRKLHWEPVSATKVHNTVWMNMTDSRVSFDLRDFESTFAVKKKKVEKKAAEDKAVAEGGKKKKAASKVSILPVRRAQVISIALAKFGRSNEELHTALLECDLKVLDADASKRLLDILPSEDTKREIDQYQGDLRLLARPEQFFHAIGGVAHLSLRLNTLCYYHEFADKMAVLQGKLNTVRESIKVLKNSDNVQKVLEVVLAFGNFMNGSKGGVAYGFRISSLNRLASTKSVDNQTTLLHYLVDHIESKMPEVAVFVDELKICKEATRIESSFLSSEVSLMGVGLKQVVQGLERVQDCPRYTAVMTAFQKTAKPEVEALRTKLHACKTDAAELAQYFGEEAKMKWEDLFDSFYSFTAAYNRVRNEILLKKEQEEAKKKREANAERMRQRRSSSRLSFSRPSSRASFSRPSSRMGLRPRDGRSRSRNFSVASSLTTSPSQSPVHTPRSVSPMSSASTSTTNTGTSTSTADTQEEAEGGERDGHLLGASLKQHRNRRTSFPLSTSSLANGRGHARHKSMSASASNSKRDSSMGRGDGGSHGDEDDVLHNQINETNDLISMMAKRRQKRQKKRKSKTGV